VKIVCLHDKDEIAAFLRHNIYLHLYTIGDLDDFFWSYTTWYALKDDRSIRQIVLVYTGTQVPTLLALTHQHLDDMRALLKSILHLLPHRFYAHLTGDLRQVFESIYRVESLGQHSKMALINPDQVAAVDSSAAQQITIADLPELKAFYEASYPGNWFDPRMLETGCYYGIRHDGAFVSAAGVHVYSPEYSVAALGNITTHPRARGRGLGAAVTAAVCRALLPRVSHIGLNVSLDNPGAIACYRKLGFDHVATYEECLVELPLAN
jgi:ribosomal protein S18 acetylase RimI-like enzyme